jgi:hypothetical protein
LFVVFS